MTDTVGIHDEDGGDYSFLEPLAQGIKRPRVGFFYQLGLLLVALAMVLLPLIYLALIFAAGWATYHHAVHHFQPIMTWGTANWRVMLIKVFLYGAPLVVGVIIVFFMIKPLLARRPKAAQPLALNPGAEPVLFAFIEAVCRAVKAPMPRRVDLDCHLNAAAGFRKGFLSFLGSDLVLLIGLPLAGNLTVAELAGVLAHEFGHFSQGLGMRVSYLVRSVNGWFARVVYERDAFDVSLQEAAEQAEGMAELILFNLARLGVGFSRLILTGLMYLGHGISCFMSRQMEYHADLHEIRLCGSEIFETTTNKFATLSEALQRTYKEMRVRWNSSHILPESLPAALRVTHAELPVGVVDKIHSRLGLQRSGIFATHPSPGDRIRQSRRAAAPGIFHDDRPATVLFQNFAVAARQVTILHYRDDLGIPVLPEMLEAVESESVQDKPSTGNRIEEPDPFLGLGPLIFPFAENDEPPTADVEDAVREAQDIGDQLVSLATELEPLTRQYGDTHEQWTRAEALRRLSAAGVSAISDGPGTPETAQEVLQELAHSLREVAGAMQRRFQLCAFIARTRCEPEQDPLARLWPLANEFARWRKASDELEIARRMLELAGELPEAREAIERQIESIERQISPVESGDIAATPATPGPRLKFAPRAAPSGGTKLKELEKRIRGWHHDYAQTAAAIWRIGDGD